MVKGYKVFNPDWTCRGKQYACPGMFEEAAELKVCKRGMHFCKQAIDCFDYYGFDPKNHVAEVIAHGTVVEDGDKCCTDKLEIVREIPWEELLEIVNTGKGCTGKGNTGNWNTGNWNTGIGNTGDKNTGDRNTGIGNTGIGNTGDWNIGNGNTGNRNTGDWNTGYWNTGDRNTGNWNTGNGNIGDWNKGNYCTGNFNIADRCCGDFCTEEQPLILFDRPCNMTRAEWDRSDAMNILRMVDFTPVRWVSETNMTEEEKAKHPEHKTTGGYLKRIDTEPDFYESCWRKWWGSLTFNKKKIIQAIPNFDAEKFKKITGIEVCEEV